jgi:Na+/proline symporter
MGTLISYLLLAKPLREASGKFGTVTLSDFIGLRYRSEGVRVLATIGIIIGLTGYMMTNLKALGSIGEIVFGWNYAVSLTIGTVVVGMYVVMGGMLAAAATDAFQSILMIVASVAMMVVGVIACGGFTAMHNTLASVDVDLLKFVHDGEGTSYTIWWALGTVFLYALGVSGQPHVVNKFCQIQNTKMLKISMIIGVGTYFLVGLSHYTGVAARALTIKGNFPHLLKNTDLVSSTFTMQMMPAPVAGCILAAILAAIMSTTSSIILTISSAFTKDLCFKYLVKSPLTPQKELFYARAASLLFVVISYCLVFNPPALVVWMGYGAWGILAATLFPLIVFGVRWKRGGRIAAYCGIIAGLIGSFGLVLLQYGFGVKFSIPPAIIGFAGAIVVYFVVALVTPVESNVIFPLNKEDAEYAAAAAQKNIALQ